jgi:hypothetical protein
MDCPRCNGLVVAGQCVCCSRPFPFNPDLAGFVRDTSVPEGLGPHYSRGKSCPECGTPITDTSSHCKKHIPRGGLSDKQLRARVNRDYGDWG